MTQRAPADLLSHVGLAVLVHRPDGGFEPLVPLTGWLAHLVAPLLGPPGGLGDDLLAHAAAAAEEAWAAGELGADEVVGPWVEADDAGQERALEASSTTIGGRHLLLVRDVSREHGNLRDVLQAGREALLDRERLLREQQARDVLLHCIVHDLGGPLTSLRASLQLLDAPDLPEAERTELKSIAQRSVERQHELVHDILGAFKAELRSLEHASEETGPPDVREVAARVVRSLSPAAREGGVVLTLETAADPQDGWRCVGEASRLERVVTNLVENALRHSPEGCPVLVRLEARDGAAILSVLDRGPGVPADAVTGIFVRGAQGRTQPGRAGLGLFFCRQTIERWGGSIGFEARSDGKGSRFWFRLPLVGKPAR